jgi:hypothetical protein
MIAYAVNTVYSRNDVTHPLEGLENKEQFLLLDNVSRNSKMHGG